MKPKQNKIKQTFEVDFWFQKNPASETKKIWVLLIGLIVLRMWICRSAQCLRNQWHTTKKLEVIKKVFFQKHCFGSTFQPTQFELPEKFWQHFNPNPHKLFNQSQENDHFDNQVCTLPKSKLQVCLQELSWHTSTAFTTASSNAIKSKTLSTKLALCLTFFAQIWKTAFVWLESWFVSKKDKKNQISVQCLRKWTWLFCLCVCSFFLVDLFMSFVFLFCFSVLFSFNSNKQSIAAKWWNKKIKTKTDQKPFWCELEKKNDDQQQVCFFLFTLWVCHLFWHSFLWCLLQHLL